MCSDIVFVKQHGFSSFTRLSIQTSELELICQSNHMYTSLFPLEAERIRSTCIGKFDCTHCVECIQRGPGDYVLENFTFKDNLNLDQIQLQNPAEV